MSSDLKDRFYDKVQFNPATGCMEWTACTNSHGYGAIQVEGKPLGAHRVRYELETGLEIPKGLCICHRCDNPRCVTISHLFLGTKADNMRDKVKKGRQAKGKYGCKGEKHPRVTVSDAEKERVIAAYETGNFTHKELADQVGVHPETVRCWVVGRRRAS